MADNSSNSGSSNPSTSGNNAIGQFGQSPFGRLKEVVPEKDLPKIFSGVGQGESGGSPFGGGAAAGASGSQPDLPYGGNPFAGDNFWNIFAGGVNPSKVGGGPSAVGGSPSAVGGSPSAVGSPSAGSSNQGSGRDPLTGSGSQAGGISTTEIPDAFGLRVTIDKLVSSRLDKELGGGKIPSSGGGQIPSFDAGQIPSFGGVGQSPSFGGTGGGIPSFGGTGEGIPSFGGTGGGIPSFGGTGGGIPSFGGQ
ncbi:hypothetical protein NIES4072_39710 [Nostoc commune NIES-4072]|uniref:Uncharacterized protein n=1 Tax=Nostoc commune NIES-4072 TaxID=2005467 RepID=A0A2R5FXB0_NOSCO|nr:hypothetical protein [Nostoc commune]BBD68706.1 hypothetical protein NIES4070_51060 [Nostoc commune HK-02]GBG20294.1 hypothetical protein NIES4072_39710 [Nostoc commune NIES-4072]